MARRGGEGGGAGPMNTLIGAFIGLIVIAAIVTFGPTIGGMIEQAQPTLSATSDWNATHNPNLPDGEDIWTQNVTIGGVVILVFFIALALFYLRSIG